MCGVLDDCAGGHQVVAGGELGEFYVGEHGGREELGWLYCWAGMGCLYEHDCGQVVKGEPVT